MTESTEEVKVRLPEEAAEKSLSYLARHRQLAPSASVRVSPLCLGALNFGDAYKERYGECNKETSFAILDCFYQHGGNFIDTANAYQAGDSETWVGEWMATRGNRDEIVLATKYSNSPYPKQWLAQFSKWIGDANRNQTNSSDSAPKRQERLQSNYAGNGLKSMRLSIEESLRRLQTTYIDLFYVHFWDFTVSIPELMQGLNDLVRSGKVLYLGISDAPAWVVSKANQYARDHGLRQFSVYQGLWNAGIRDFERDIIPMCRDEGMGICPYGTLGQGRFQTEADFKEREEKNIGRRFIPVSQRDKDVSRVLETIAKEKNTKITDVALSYVLHKEPYVFPIVGGRKVEHLKGNISALGVRLNKEDVQRVEAAYEFDHGFPHTFLSGSLFDGTASRPANGPADVWLTKNSGTFEWVEPLKPITRPAE